MSFGSRPASRKMAAGDSPALYLHMTSMRKLSAYRICDALTLSTAGRLAKYARSFAVNFPSTILSSPYTAWTAWFRIISELSPLAPSLKPSNKATIPPMKKRSSIVKTNSSAIFHR